MHKHRPRIAVTISAVLRGFLPETYWLNKHKEGIDMVFVHDDFHGFIYA